MQNDFRKILFSSLLTVFIIISNLVGIKYTDYHGLILSVNLIFFVLFEKRLRFFRSLDKSTTLL